MMTEELWWGRTPNPARFQRDVLEQVELENSVVLNFPGDVPWRSVFISMLQNSLHQTSATRDFLVIEAPYERDPKKRMEPGEFILKNHCEQWDYDNYWPTQTYGQYLASKPVTLHQMYIYVKGIHRDECEAWFQFVRDYLESFPENAQHAVFLLEVQCSSVSGYRQLTFLNYQDYVSDYDGLMLCLAVTAPLRCSSTAWSPDSDTARATAEPSGPSSRSRGSSSSAGCWDTENSRSSVCSMGLSWGSRRYRPRR